MNSPVGVGTVKGSASAQRAARMDGRQQCWRLLRALTPAGVQEGQQGRQNIKKFAGTRLDITLTPADDAPEGPLRRGGRSARCKASCSTAARPFNSNHTGPRNHQLTECVFAGGGVEQRDRLALIAAAAAGVAPAELHQLAAPRLQALIGHCRGTRRVGSGAGWDISPHVLPNEGRFARPSAKGQEMGGQPGQARCFRPVPNPAAESFQVLNEQPSSSFAHRMPGPTGCDASHHEQ